ncbi:hypothetical protein LX32DRAFT_667892 [Colletotrichum zoysiae]|uniref:Uncharacterized protein n=1 Tax=Colletotrichum zoysiae TaxID=1216348 RepID=A0AAD9H6H8_9PEZI|nr:hypothetical protein LX32DRAFT_667892 [Colletotrichum zoysiae]
MRIHVRSRDPCQVQLHRPFRHIRQIRLHSLNYPRPHVQSPHRDGDLEPVSPVSDTLPLPGPKSYTKANDEDLPVGGDWVPRPTGKAQTSWDPLANTPLVQGTGSEMGRSGDPTPHAPNAHQATQTQTATAPRNNPADDQYDDWVVVSSHSASSSHIQVISPQSPPVSSLINGVGVRPNANHTQTIQHLPSQQQQAESPQRNSSFVGLPPIRRGSTFGINLTKRAKRRFSLDEDEDAHLVSSPVSNAADQHGHGDSNWSTESAHPARIDTGPSKSRKDSGMSHGAFSATTGRPLAPGAAFKGAGRVPRPIYTGVTMQPDRRMDGPPYGPGMRSQQGMVSPTFGGAGNPIHHLPPQGPWKLEDRSQFFGYEKETGTQLPPRLKFSEVPPSSAQRYPGLFSPPQWEQNLGSPTGPRRSHDLGRQYYGRDSTSLYRTQTGDSEVSTFDPSIDEERGRSRRSSGFLKEIGNHFSRESSRRRPASKAEEAAVSIPGGPDVQRNEVLEASVDMGELQDQQRRRSSFFLNLRGSRSSDAGVPQGREGEGTTQSPKASHNSDVTFQSQQLAGFADRKRSFLGSAGNESPSPLPMPNLSRSSTSTAGNGATGGAFGPPKKRFSGFASKVFNRNSSQQDLQISRKPDTSHSATSPTLGRPPDTTTKQPGDHATAETGARPVSDVESDEQATLLPPRPEAQNANVSRKNPDSLLNRTSQAEENPGVYTSQTQEDQRSPEPHRVSEPRQYSSSTQLYREQLMPPKQPNDQNQQSWVPPGFSAEPTPEASIRRGKEPEGALSPLIIPPSQSDGGNTHTLDIQEYGPTRRVSGQSASLLSSPVAKAQSPNAVVGQTEISQRSSISNSPKPPVTSQMQPPAADTVTQMPPPSDRRSPLSFLGHNQPLQSQGPHDHDQQSSVSKWFRNRTSTQIEPSQSHQGHTKESTARSIFSAFKRSSKQTDARPLQQQQMARQGQAQPLQSKAQRLPLQGFIEPQYDQVPIPQGYAAVHGEGSVVPSPYAIPRTSPPVQFLPHQAPPVQQWSPPSTALRHPSEGSLYNHSGAAAPHVQHLPQSHIQPNTIPEGGRRISLASHQSNMSYESRSTQPGTGGPNGDRPMFRQHNQQNPTGSLNTQGNDNSRVAGSNSRHSQQALLLMQQPYHQRSSPANPVTPSVAPPQTHQTHSGDIQGENAIVSQTQVYSGHVQAAPQTAASLRPQFQSQTRGLAADAGSVAGSNSRSASPGTQASTERVVFPEPPVSAPVVSPLVVNVHKANHGTPDDIYDSTPRLPSGPPPPPPQPIAATATGQSMVSDSSADEAPRNATHANGGGNGESSTNVVRGKSARAELEDTEDERKRTIRHEAQEEKILVDPYEELESGGVKYRKEEDPEIPQMSATSYPGQEWNPYGAGGYEDWD